MVTAQTRSCLGTRQAGFQCQENRFFKVVGLSDPDRAVNLILVLNQVHFFLNFLLPAARTASPDDKSSRVAGSGTGAA